MRSRYDYIVAGAGASGLSLAAGMSGPAFTDKKILVVDDRLDAGNTKTWCFWCEGPPPWPELICRTWNCAEVGVNGKVIRDRLHSHSYHCIRSGDFRTNLLSRLEGDERFDLLEKKVTALEGDAEEARLYTDEGVYRADYIFQSCFNPREDSRSSPMLKQHFLGWEVLSSRKTFESDRFVLMDFDQALREGIAFVYLLPWSDESALVEYTVFSERTLPARTYEEKIERYLADRYDMNLSDYKVTRTEKGTIPMDPRGYPRWYAPRILNMGMKGGLTKASSGYTFYRIQQHCSNILDRLQKGSPPVPASGSPFRFFAYDLWLLQIMKDNPRQALRIFEALFSRNSFDDLFRFLSEKSSFGEDLRIMASVPPRPFLKAIWRSGKPLLGRLWSGGG